MGNIIKLFLDWFSGITKCRMLMLGLDASGKTTILYKLKLGELVTTIPTIVFKKGFNVEALEYKNFELTIWDVGGQDKIRLLWRHYYKNTQGLIYVIDSHDKERLQEAVKWLANIIKDKDMEEQPILILANKNDLPNTLTTDEIINEANSILKDRVFFIQPCCAMTGEGLYEGLDWLASVLGKKKYSSIE